MTLGDYLLKESGKASPNLGLAVSEMTIDKPLIATGKGQQLYHASATADWKTMQTEVKIFSVNANGKKTVDHAKCTIATRM